MKCEVYGAVAMLHLGCHAEDEKKMGYRLGFQFEFFYFFGNFQLKAVSFFEGYGSAQRLIKHAQFE